MKKYINHIATLFFALVVCALVFAFFDVRFVKALEFAAIAAAVQVLTWRLYSYKTRIGYALSFIPAAFVLLYICLSGTVWVICSAVSLVVLVLLYHRQLVETREATQNWVASAIFVVLMAFLAAMLVAL